MICKVCGEHFISLDGTDICIPCQVGKKKQTIYYIIPTDFLDDRGPDNLFFAPATIPTPEGFVRIKGLHNRAGMPCLVGNNPDEVYVLSFKGIAEIGAWCKERMAKK
jgi:hypothetical protein